MRQEIKNKKGGICQWKENAPTGRGSAGGEFSLKRENRRKKSF